MTPWFSTRSVRFAIGPGAQAPRRTCLSGEILDHAVVPTWADRRAWEGQGTDTAEIDVRLKEGHDVVEPGEPTLRASSVGLGCRLHRSPEERRRGEFPPRVQEEGDGELEDVGDPFHHGRARGSLALFVAGDRLARDADQVAGGLPLSPSPRGPPGALPPRNPECRFSLGLVLLADDGNGPVLAHFLGSHRLGRDVGIVANEEIGEAWQERDSSEHRPLGIQEKIEIDAPGHQVNRKASCSRIR